MKRLTTCIVSLILMSTLVSPVQANIKLRMVSFDIMNMQEGESYLPWMSRSTAICRKLHKLKADIVALQDVDSLQLVDVSQGLPELSVAPEKTFPGYTHQHTNPILYNSKVLKLVDRGTFFIADPPEEPANSWNSNYASTVCWCIFQHIETGESFLVANTKWDSIDANYRQDASILIKIHLGKMTNKTPIIMVGNFDKSSDDIFYNALRSRVFLLKDSWTIAKKKEGIATVNNLKDPDSPLETMVDFFFTSPEFVIKKMSIISTWSKDYFLSDHNIILTEMIL